ncbi:ATP synthase F1 subunit delta [Mycoplasmopsis columbina]|uniref:ATP synthase subunit delta n=1 Tax=Mycoplasmopsis columbina SF7 TaxID=1037410 RepID=F9UJQ8_9BACT|nr:ATP synthase F1 subunit delta [Mycoplasmopsis columbina]EGV00439.1 ATP synthase subunit delta [Mycoplasmopsis columbina SF7]VEU76696.1 ATP synthase delta chain [Mycoplasmopsis columbina]
MYKKINLDAYAIAIYELSLEMNVAHETRYILTALYKELKKDELFIENLKNGEISKEEKNAYISDVLAGFEKNQLAINFINIILENGAIQNLKRIISVYLKMVNQHLNVRYAKIFSPFPITKDKLNLIKAKLEKDYNCIVDIDNIIDPNVIGGFKIKMDSLVIEHSLGSDLQQLTNQIKSKDGGLNG